MNKKAFIKTILWMLRAFTFSAVAFFGSIILAVVVWSFFDSLPDAVVVIGGTLVFIIGGLSLLSKEKYNEFKEEEI